MFIERPRENVSPGHAVALDFPFSIVFVSSNLV